ncbi:cytochrome c4 [Azospirillum sp. TSO22-1]|uniref:c-type cytochrome n=1 Tax=Azospirillum sp. TSO22-1 TaxID=716789 RepID=UPI000D65D431|nr:cytochrome c4 [Azospirillum sp. TSO22-1]
MTVRRVILAALLSASPGAMADTLVTDGAPPWEMCGECHGLDGLSAVPRFPRLAGQDRAYIEKQLRDFRAGRRRNDGGQMSGSVSELTDETIPPVAAHFSAQAPLPASPAGDPRARRVIAEGDAAAGIPPCRSCHGTGAPRLEGQHAGYLAKQLRDFRDGRRDNDADGAMRAVAARLSDADVEALSHALQDTETTRP